MNIKQLPPLDLRTVTGGTRRTVFVRAQADANSGAFVWRDDYEDLQQLWLDQPGVIFEFVAFVGFDSHKLPDDEAVTQMLDGHYADHVAEHDKPAAAEMGTMIPKESLIMTVHMGEAGNSTHQYGLATNLSGNPVIESKTSGKRYSFSWQSLIDYAIQRGINLK